ncbi:hypothetical protein EON79_21465 [bacterium]|nr:MAG: hypothetical protein EON79_21465 [bacterium]
MKTLSILLLPALALLAGCGTSENGSAPQNVSAEQRAKDVQTEAQGTISWLEQLTPEQRQAALAQTPQIKATLAEVKDPALRARLDAMGIK